MVMVTTGVLDLIDASAKIDRAKELHGELTAALKEWQDTGGVEAQSRRSLQFVCYIGYAKVNSVPPINVALRAGEVLGEHLDTPTAAIAETSRTRRLLPMPGGPTTPTTAPWPSIARSNRPSTADISHRRPTRFDSARAR